VGSDDREELIRSIRLSPIASIVTDPNAPDNPIIAVNEQFERLTGYTEDGSCQFNADASRQVEDGPLRARFS
jgi:PAS domain-containing protein